MARTRQTDFAKRRKLVQVEYFETAESFEHDLVRKIEEVVTANKMTTDFLDQTSAMS